MIGPACNIWTPASPQGGPWGADHLWLAADHPLAAGSWVDSIGGAVLNVVGAGWNRNASGVQATGGAYCQPALAAISDKLHGATSWRTLAFVGTDGGGGAWIGRRAAGGRYAYQQGYTLLNFDIWGDLYAQTPNCYMRGTSALKVYAIAYDWSSSNGLRFQPISGSAWVNKTNAQIPVLTAAGWTEGPRLFSPYGIGAWGGRLLAVGTAPGIASLAEIQDWAASLGVAGI